MTWVFAILAILIGLGLAATVLFIVSAVKYAECFDNADRERW